MKHWLNRFWKENKPLILFVFLMFAFRSAVADWNDVPTGSMRPTIKVGDVILVDRMAYDIRVPFTHISLYSLSNPRRGDIVIFDSKVLDEKLVKRVIGVPGDIVELKDNILYINGKRLAYTSTGSTAYFTNEIENLVGVKHKIRVKNGGSPYSSFSSVKVPGGCYFVMGDNRDNSADSRFIGFVSRGEIVGRSRRVILSLNFDDHYLPRSNRFFHKIN